MSFFHCKCKWGFPRRWPEFQGERDVDVQVCTTCGARRVSPIQFGPARFEAMTQTLWQRFTGRIKWGLKEWMHTHS